MTINESIYMALSVSEESKVSPLLMGNPGAGKTTSVEFYAKANGMEMVLLRGSQSSPEEILGYEVNDGESHSRDGKKMDVKVASKICPKWYDKVWEHHDKGVRTLLFLDEITTASSFVQAALLQVIFGREIDNGYALPEDTFVVAAGNYSGNLSSDFNLLPPLMNRFCIYNVTIGSSDIKSFLSRYSDRQDIVSKLKAFDAQFATSTSDIDPSFVDLVKKTMETKVCDFTVSLIKNKKYDPNVSEMTDIYQDTSQGTELLGFVTPRTLNYFRDTAVHMYLKFGTYGIQSEVFRKMADGLVGISLSSNSGNKNSQVSKQLMSNEFVNLIDSVAQQLDKKKVTAIASTEKQIERIITKLDENGKKVNINILPSSELIQLSKVFESALGNRDLHKVKTPIDPKTILDCEAIVLSTARDVLKSDNTDIKSLIEAAKTGVKLDKSKVNIDKINGNIKNYNDAIKVFNSIYEFVNVSEFDYQSDVLKKMNDDYFLLQKNQFRVDSLKKNLRTHVGISMSELVETSSLINKK